MPSVNPTESAKMSDLEEQSIAVFSERASVVEAVKDSSSPAVVNQQLPNVNNTNNAKDALSPVQQMCLIIEHKIRNLQKRKNKLDSYKLFAEEGKKLSTDQKMATLKYDECVTSLELVRELCKQFSAIASAATKDAKRQAKKNAFFKVQQENAKVRECLVILNIISHFSDEAVREDFLNGTNGACQLVESDVELLLMVYELSKPNRPLKSTERSFSSAVRNAADVLCGIVDGKAKPFGTSNYAHAKSIINSIESCGYFDKYIVYDADCQTVEENQLSLPQTSECEAERNETVIASPASTPAINAEGEPLVFAEAPAATAVPTPSFPLQTNEVQLNSLNARQPLTPTNKSHMSPANPIASVNANVQSGAVIVSAAAINIPVVHPVASVIPQHAAPTVAATTVQAVENAYFKQHYIQNHLRPLHEVLGNANFFFLQESEIDKPDIPPLHSTYVAVEQPITSIPLKAAANELQQIPSVQDPHLVMSVKGSTQNTTRSSLAPNVTVPSCGGIVPNGSFPNQFGLINDGRIMNVQSFQGSAVNRDSMSGLQHSSADVLRAPPTQQTGPIHHLSPSILCQQQQQVSQSTTVNQSERQYIAGFASACTSIPHTLPVTDFQELGKLPSKAHASVQTNKSVGIVPMNDISKEVHPMHNMNDTIVAPMPIVSTHTPTMGSKDLHQSPRRNAKVGVLSVKASLKKGGNNPPEVNTANESYVPKSDDPLHSKKTGIAKVTTEERKEWLKGTGCSNSLSKNDEQWPSPASSVAQAQLKMDDNVGRTHYNRMRSSANGQTVAVGARSITPSSSSGKNHSNGGSMNAKCISNSAAIPNSTTVNPSLAIANHNSASTQPAGFRNNRSSNTQYSHNGLNNGRSNAENGVTAGHPPTFFKNNERFYQNNYGLQRGGTMYKGRSEHLSGNAGPRSHNNSGYISTSSAGLGNGATNAPVVGSDFRNNQHARSGGNARGNGSLGGRSHQRNNIARET